MTYESTRTGRPQGNGWSPRTWLEMVVVGVVFAASDRDRSQPPNQALASTPPYVPATDPAAARAALGGHCTKAKALFERAKAVAPPFPQPGTSEYAQDWTDILIEQMMWKEAASLVA